MNFRRMTEADRSVLECYIREDPWHAPDYVERALSFYRESAANLFADEKGIVVFIKAVPESVNRVHLYFQFGPPSEVSKKRIAIVLGRYLPRLIETLHKMNYGEVVLTSLNEKALVFVEKHCGFTLLDRDKHMYIHHSDTSEVTIPCHS